MIRDVNKEILKPKHFAYQKISIVESVRPAFLGLGNGFSVSVLGPGLGICSLGHGLGLGTVCKVGLGHITALLK